MVNLWASLLQSSESSVMIFVENRLIDDGGEGRRVVVITLHLFAQLLYIVVSLPPYKIDF